MFCKLCKRGTDPWPRQQRLYKRKTRFGVYRSPLPAKFFVILHKMSKYFTVWVCLGVLSTLLPAAGAVECSETDLQLRSRPRLIPSMVAHLTDCLRECTGMTYIKKLQLQDNHNIRLTDSTEGKVPQEDIFNSRRVCCEFSSGLKMTWAKCWDIFSVVKVVCSFLFDWCNDLLCIGPHEWGSLPAGDSGEYCWSMEFQCIAGESFQHAYVLLPVDIAAGGHKRLEVKATAQTTTRLQAHNGPTPVAEDCGLRYEVTEHFLTEEPGASFCIQVVRQEGVLGDNALRCPPYLVTLWQRNPNQSNQQGGGWNGSVAE